MAEAKSIDKLHSLRRNWMALRLLADVLLAAAIGLVIAAVAYCFGQQPRAYLIAGFALSEIVMLVRHRTWELPAAQVASFLNKQYPQLEESAELVLMPTDSLTLLQRLQLSKTELTLGSIPDLPKAFFRPVLRNLVILGSAVVLVIVFFRLTERYFIHVIADPLRTTQTVPEKHLPQIDAVSITITPPAYTGKPKRGQEKFTLLAEEGAMVSWQLITNVAVKQISLLFNDREKINLKPTENQTRWTAQRNIAKPGFYQVSIDGKLSDLYQVEVIRDGPPVIYVKSPKQYTYIDAGEAPRTTLHTVVNDDYGIAGALVFATVAKGSGEGVKFKEYQMPFDVAFGAHQREYNLQKLFDLPKLDMEPGDQLYFYIEAQDTHRQKTRTDVYTVTIQDTAQLLSMNGLLTGSNLKPEFFRSERQIILDTEKLIRDRDSISKEQFNTRSNELATDQKLLRLRYGKFLGEEDESDIDGPGSNADLGKAENFSNDKLILDAYTDKHDNAEDATFLEPAVKAQLKATLTEMWKAELQLRLYKPQAAVPFEYKALRLLKDLQQKSRAYVAKTAYNPPPLKLEKRMSGELEKINQPDNRRDVKVPADKQLALKAAVQVLEQLKLTKKITSTDRRTLQTARGELAEKAATEPGVYLKAVGALTRLITADIIHANDIILAEKALQQTLPNMKVLPGGTSATGEMGLSGFYYQNLKQHNR